MTKKELKSIIKECIREIVFEENFLSPLISEIATGVSSNTHTINEVKTNTTKPSKAPNYNKISHARKKLLDGIGSSALGGVDVFKDVSAERVNERREEPGISMRSLEKIPGLANAANIVKALGTKR
tara:strand:- start:1903 stop:2280 length:378 start_codon:yes stop_codon:yes gene_type:complete